MFPHASERWYDATSLCRGWYYLTTLTELVLTRDKIYVKQETA
jgi:hypothetical protein